MLHGTGSPAATLAPDQVAGILEQAFAALPLDGQRVLVIIPDATRSAPIPLMFDLLYARLGAQVARLDYLIALGTHAPMSEAAIDQLVGCAADQRARRFPKSAVLNHAWHDPDALTQIGTIGGDEMATLTGGLWTTATPVRINRMAHEYDQIIICGPVFPHEVVGFSGGAKYLFPGIAAREIIDTTHWIGALVTVLNSIGIKDTPMRRVIHRAAEFVTTPITLLAMVMRGDALHGLYTGDLVEAWSAAADLSAQLNIVVKPHLFQRVLSLPSTRYPDLWTAAKAMYKTEPVVADGGEIIIYAPHISEVSYSHGALLDEVGYHVLAYFTKQPGRFAAYPGGVLAHSTHVKGVGSYDPASGVERPRIQVTLATAIPEARCRQINLGYRDPHTIDPQDWANREDEGLLLVEHAGEVLYRCATMLYLPDTTERLRGV
ncbi:MAG: DUF2088 domain-containing protein [Roseiflexaceae bacterium]|nr:DUF2088 domain-containing protein [Roseiflexaceae bacterium]